jgi:hypothetical protein
MRPGASEFSIAYMETSPKAMSQTPTPTSNVIVAKERERDRLAEAPGCRFVDAEEFAALAISWRKMERRNISSCDLLGLYDMESNEWFLLEEEKFADLLAAN